MTISRRFQCIAVGDNGTAEADQAVAAAVELAACCHAKLLLLAVAAEQTAEQQAEGFGMETATTQTAKLRGKLEQAAAAGREQGVEVIVLLARGEAETEIERLVTEHGVDLLLVGRRNVSTPRRWLEGSISEDFLHRLNVSLLIVHPASSGNE